VATDPYRVLGVPRDASPEEVQDAYRRLVKLHHPDRSGGWAEPFLEIQAAYAAVRDRPSAESLEKRLAEMEHKLREEHAARGRAQAREDPAVRRVGDLIDGLEDLASKLDRC
jgi:curved DNA-binding protein CbpA